MIDSRIHRNMKTARGGSVPKTRLLWPFSQQIRKYGRAILSISTMTKDCHDELGSQFLLHCDLYKFSTVRPVWFFFFLIFIIPVFLLFCFWKRNYIYYTSVCCVQVMKRQSKRKNLQNSESPLSFLFGNIGLCSRYNFDNYGT